MADLDRLLREQNPEPGQPRIPVPQYQKVGGLGYEKVTGQYGGAHAVLLGPNGQPISSGNRLAVDTGLNGNLQIVADNQGRLYGSPDGGTTWKAVKVNSGGQLELAQTVVIDNVTVNVGAEVAVYNRNDEPLKVQQSGTIVTKDVFVSGSTTVIEIQPGSLYTMVAVRPINMDFKEVIIGLVLYTHPSNLEDGYPALRYNLYVQERANSAFDQIRGEILETEWAGKKVSEGGVVRLLTKPLPVAGCYEELQISNPSDTTPLMIRGFAITYRR